MFPPKLHEDRRMIGCLAIFAACIGSVILVDASRKGLSLHNARPLDVKLTPSLGIRIPSARASILQAAREAYADEMAQIEAETVVHQASPIHNFGIAALCSSFLLAIAGFGVRFLSSAPTKAQAAPFAILAASAAKGKKAKKSRKDQKTKTEKTERPPPPELPRKVVFSRMRKGVLRRAKKPTKTTGRVCALLGKVDNRKARQISFSHIRTKRVQKVNLQWKRLYWEEAKIWVRLRLSTKGIKTITKYGLHQAAIKFGLDLTKHLNGTSERKYVKYLPEKEKKLAMVRGAHSRYLSAVRWAKLNDEEVPAPPANLQTPLQRKRSKRAKKKLAEEPTEIAMAISHGNRLPRLGRAADQRKALLRNLTTELIRHGRIMTTIVKARAVRKHVDHMISLAKGGSLHQRRQALAYIYDKDLVKTLFEQVPERYPAREGGYTRIIRTMPRRGDCAPMCFIELV